MEELKHVLDEYINDNLSQMVLSNPRNKEEGIKVKIRPVLIKEDLLFQETLYKGTKVYHSNFTEKEIKERVISYVENNFKQGEIVSSIGTATILISKKGKITINKKKRDASVNEKQVAEVLLQHNRKKQYIFEDGKPIDFLVGLGVQTPEGKVVKAKYDKFRQINRYLEFIEDITAKLPTQKTIKIIDFGCGKSYLTFAMYYYLHIMKGYLVEVVGLDLKKDVIEHCNRLAKEYGYESLHFELGDISTYDGTDEVDMVVTLHACDTATDYAIDKAIKWGAKVIMAVPCCQHEVNKQILCEPMNQILKYGLIKERISALITDSLRANMLEEMGYETQVLEFIDMEHTPKNLLIRAVKRNQMQAPKKTSVKETCEYFHVNPTLQKLLDLE